MNVMFNLISEPRLLCHCVQRPQTIVGIAETFSSLVKKTTMAMWGLTLGKVSRNLQLIPLQQMR